MNTESAVTIRVAIPKDEDRIVELWDELMKLHEAIEPVFQRCQGAVKPYRKFLRGNITKDESCVVVAEAHGKIVGYMMAIETDLPPVLQVKRIVAIVDAAVTAQYRRSGIGGQILERLTAWAKSRGFGELEMTVAVANDQARAFWRAAGARPYAEVMRIPLPPSL